MGFKWALIALAMTARADDDDDGGAGSINCAGPLVATQATPAEQCPNIAMLHYWPINENFDCHGWRGTNVQNGGSAPASANNIRMSDDCETLTMTHYSGNLICAGDGVEQSFALGECTAGMGSLFNKGRDFDCCSSPDSCAYSDGVPSFESLQLANVTVYRDGRPCRNQNQGPTTEAPTSWCHDDPDWRSQLLTNRGCNWVASKPEDRCGLMGANESSYAHEHCLEACGCTSAPSAAPGGNDADCPSDAGWHIRDVPSKDCDWVGFAPGDRCGKLDEDGVRAYDACQAECGCTGAPSLAPTNPPTDCANDPDWYKSGRPDRTCVDYIADKPKSRCDADGEDGRVAWEACSLACGCTSMPSLEPTGEPTREPIIDPTPAPSAEPTAAPSAEPTTCPQSATWHNEGKPDKDCDWVAEDPGGRCHKTGEDGDLAWEACERACGCTAAPSEAPTGEPTSAPVGTPTPAPSVGPTSVAPTPAPSQEYSYSYTEPAWWTNIWSAPKANDDQM